MSSIDGDYAEELFWAIVCSNHGYGLTERQREILDQYSEDHGDLAITPNPPA